MPVDTWHYIASQIYDFLAHLLQTGWRLASAVARAVARWPNVAPEVIQGFGGLAVQAFAAGAELTGGTGGTMVPPERIPTVPPAEGTYHYTGYWEDEFGNRQWFEIVADHPLTLSETSKRAKEMLDIGLNIDSPMAVGGDDVIYPANRPDDALGQTVEVVITRIERR